MLHAEEISFAASVGIFDYFYDLLLAAEKSGKFQAGHCRFPRLIRQKILLLVSSPGEYLAFLAPPFFGRRV